MTHSTIDILINNAGANGLGPVRLPIPHHPPLTH